MSDITPEQWAMIGEESLRLTMRQYGMTPTPETLQDAREAAVWIATGRRAPKPENDDGD